MNPDEIRWLVYLILGAGATVACGPLFAALRPERHAAAHQQLEAAPISCLFLGLIPLGALLVLMLVIYSAQLASVWVMVVVVAGILCGLGAGISGRYLGNRLQPEGTVLSQTLIGTALIAGSSLWPAAGLVMFLIAVSLGLGGWLRAR
jgi:hypothetical protein